MGVHNQAFGVTGTVFQVGNIAGNVTIGPEADAIVIEGDDQDEE